MKIHLNNNTIFETLIDLLDEKDIDNIVNKYNGDENTRKFFSKNHLKLFMYAELNKLDSIHDMDMAMKRILELQDIVGCVDYSTISRNNSERNPQIFVEIFNLAVTKLMSLSPTGIGTNNKDYGDIKILDSSIVTMSLKLFPWSNYRSGIGGIKLHTLYDLAHSSPEKVEFTTAEVHDINLLSEFVSETGVTYLYDRAYVDYKDAHRQTLEGIYFISRLKSNAVIRVVKENSLSENSSALEDKIVILGCKGKEMETKVRIVRVKEDRTGKEFNIVTNRFDLSADEISTLYKMRWQIELFFKFIKGHMTVKHFYGNSYNAVKTQMFVAMITYCTIMILKLKYNLKCSLLELLRAIKHSPFGKQGELLSLVSKTKVKQSKKKRINMEKEYDKFLKEFGLGDEVELSRLNLYLN